MSPRPKCRVCGANGSNEPSRDDDQKRGVPLDQLNIKLAEGMDSYEAIMEAAAATKHSQARCHRMLGRPQDSGMERILFSPGRWDPASTYLRRRDQQTVVALLYAHEPAIRTEA